MIGKLNNIIADLVARGASTMACVWLFLAWSIVPLLMDISDMTPREFVLYVSAGIIQLVFLPLLLVAGRAAELRAQQQFDAVTELLGDVREDHESLRELLADARADHAQRYQELLQVIKPD
jgi:hypothetical protein